MGVWRCRGGCYCASESSGLYWNACDARALNRSERAEQVEKSARSRVVVAGDTRDYASLRSGAYTNSRYGHYCGDISQRERFFAVHIRRSRFVHVGLKHRMS